MAASLRAFVDLAKEMVFRNRAAHLVQRGRLLRTCRESDHRSAVPQD
jgi:hypothetical protein